MARPSRKRSGFSARRIRADVRSEAAARERGSPGVDMRSTRISAYARPHPTSRLSRARVPRTPSRPRAGRMMRTSWAPRMPRSATPVSFERTAAAMHAIIASTAASRPTLAPRRQPSPSSAPAARACAATPPKQKSAHSISARPTVPVTASTWTGCAAKRRETRRPSRRPPDANPRHARADVSAAAAHTAACSAALTRWNAGARGAPSSHAWSRKVRTVSGR